MLFMLDLNLRNRSRQRFEFGSISTAQIPKEQRIQMLVAYHERFDLFTEKLVFLSYVKLDLWHSVPKSGAMK